MEQIRKYHTHFLTCRNKFQYGDFYTSVTINRIMQLDLEIRKEVDQMIERFIACDWGEVSQTDQQSNDSAVIAGNQQLHGIYCLKDGRKIDILTSDDRTQTRIMFALEQ